MSDTAEKSDPALWDKVKAETIAGTRGGGAGQWSARKAQVAVQEYKRRGGGYLGKRDPHNSLHEWSDEDWGTKSGHPSGETGERYLPRKAREALSDEDYARTTAAKRVDTAKGRQFSPQPTDIAERTRPFRDHRTRADLYAEARKRDIPGRSTMTKAQLADALADR